MAYACGGTFQLMDHNGHPLGPSMQCGGQFVCPRCLVRLRREISSLERYAMIYDYQTRIQKGDTGEYTKFCKARDIELLALGALEACIEAEEKANGRALELIQAAIRAAERILR